MWRLLQRFVDYKVVVPKAERYYGHSFRTDIGVIQGDPVSPTVFNVMVDVVVSAIIMVLCVSQE